MLWCLDGSVVGYGLDKLQWLGVVGLCGYKLLVVFGYNRTWRLLSLYGNAGLTCTQQSNYSAIKQWLSCYLSVLMQFEACYAFLELKVVIAMSFGDYDFCDVYVCFEITASSFLCL